MVNNNNGIQILLLVIIVIIAIFIFSRCSLKCGSKDSYNGLSSLPPAKCPCTLDMDRDDYKECLKMYSKECEESLKRNLCRNLCDLCDC